MGALDAWNIRVLYLHCICFMNYYDIIIMIIPNVLVFTDGLLMGNKTALHLLANKDCTAMSFQSCPTLCDPIDSSPSGCPVPGILQARILEWVASSFSRA